MYVMGVNHEQYKSSDTVVGNLRRVFLKRRKTRHWTLWDWNICLYIHQ